MSGYWLWDVTHGRRQPASCSRGLLAGMGVARDILQAVNLDMVSKLDGSHQERAGAGKTLAGSCDRFAGGLVRIAVGVERPLR